MVAENKYDGEVETDIPLGNGKASVIATRGVKNWFSTREQGVTVESTMAVQITCGQSEGEIRRAGDTASQLAMEMAQDGLEAMDAYIVALRSSSR